MAHSSSLSPPRPYKEPFLLRREIFLRPELVMPISQAKGDLSIYLLYVRPPQKSVRGSRVHYEFDLWWLHLITKKDLPKKPLGLSGLQALFYQEWSMAIAHKRWPSVRTDQWPREYWPCVKKAAKEIGFSLVAVSRGEQTYILRLCAEIDTLRLLSLGPQKVEEQLLRRVAEKINETVARGRYRRPEWVFSLKSFTQRWMFENVVTEAHWGIRATERSLWCRRAGVEDSWWEVARKIEKRPIIGGGVGWKIVVRKGKWPTNENRERALLNALTPMVRGKLEWAEEETGVEEMEMRM